MKQPSLILLGLFFSASALAQPLIPLQTSNYAGTNGIYLNPSSMADSRISFQVSPGLASVSFTRQPVPFRLVPFGFNLFSAGEPRGVSKGEIRGPAIMAQFGRRHHAIGLTTRYRAGYAVSGNYDLVRWVNGTNRTAPTGPQAFNFAAEGFTEYTLSYAVSLLDWKTHHLKIGGTAKLLRGLQLLDLRGQATFAGASSSVAAPYTGASVSGSATDLAFFEGASLGQKLMGPSPGRGTAFDVGAAYEFRPKQRFYRYHMDGKLRAAEDMSKYLFRIGVSLLDIGQIDYGQFTRYAASGRSGTLQRGNYADKSPVDLQNQFISQFGLATGAETQAMTMLLPKATSVQFDVFLGRSWYGNVVYQTAVPLPTTTGLSRGRMLAFGPRSEGPGGELAGTVYYYPDIQKVSLGLHIKAGIFVLGFDNLLGIFGDNGLAPHLYGGLTIPFNARRPNDRDRDQVSDKDDQCPDVPGILAFGGCPDTDKDGIQDKDDPCPTVAGPLDLTGCPDTDKDGVLDKDDLCPTKVGLARFNGCPDTDTDGVSDNLDECPTIVGSADMGGCPDTDQDGVRDSRDLCQNEAGLIDLDGCLLRNRTVIADSLTATDSLLLVRLGQVFVRGPRLESSLQTLLSERMTAQPNQQLVIEFSGRNTKQIQAMKQLFEAEFGRLRMPVAITTVVGAEPETGFIVRFEGR